MTGSEITGSELRALYQDLILDHAKHPRNFGRPGTATHEAMGINRLCGDKLTLYLRMDDGRICEAGFEGTGCAISVASASLLTDAVSGLSGRDALALKDRVVKRLTGIANDDTQGDVGKLRALEGVKEFPSRVKCATLAWQALDAAIHQREAPASTE